MNVTITVDDRYDLDEVASQLEAAGAAIRGKMRTLSILIASVSDDAIPAIRQINGIRDVRQEQTYSAS